MPSPSRHRLRIASRLKFLIGTIIQRELSDPRLGFITVLDVETTEDFKEAKVKISVLGSSGDRSKSLHALEDARGFIQKRVGKNLRLRSTPTIRFVLVEPEDPTQKIEELLRRDREDDA